MRAPARPPASRCCGSSPTARRSLASSSPPRRARPPRARAGTPPPPASALRAASRRRSEWLFSKFLSKRADREAAISARRRGGQAAAAATARQRRPSPVARLGSAPGDWPASPAAARAHHPALPIEPRSSTNCSVFRAPLSQGCAERFPATCQRSGLAPLPGPCRWGCPCYVGAQDLPALGRNTNSCWACKGRASGELGAPPPLGGSGHGSGCCCCISHPPSTVYMFIGGVFNHRLGRHLAFSYNR